MGANADDSAVAAARVFAEGVAALLDAKTGAGLLGAYLLGSLAHGGFNRRYSDIDMALVTENGIDQANCRIDAPDPKRTSATSRTVN